MTLAAVPPDTGAEPAWRWDCPMVWTETRPRSAAACADTISPAALLLGFAMAGGAGEDVPGVAEAIVVAASGTGWRKGSVDAVIAGAACAEGGALARSWVLVGEMPPVGAPCAAAARLDDVAAIIADCVLVGVAGCALPETTGPRSVRAALLAAP